MTSSKAAVRDRCRATVTSAAPKKQLRADVGGTDAVVHPAASWDDGSIVVYTPCVLHEIA